MLLSASRSETKTKRDEQNKSPPKTQTTAGASLRLPVDGCFSKHIASFTVQPAPASGRPPSLPAVTPHPTPRQTIAATSKHVALTLAS